jgi:hypothetical protein
MIDDDAYEEVETARRMAEAARALLDSLDSTQRAKATLVFDNDDERTDWHYIPRDRMGLPIKEMDGSQRALAHKLVATGLSMQAHDRARKIMALEEVLAQLEGDGRRFMRDQELYCVSIFGDPGDDGKSWFWRFEGHHVSLNNTIVAGRLVSATPVFFGANPAQVRHGEMAGLRALKEEEEMARALLSDLDGEQRAQAIIADEAPADIITGHAVYVRDQVQAAGLASVDMSEGQREMLRKLVGVYVNRLPDALAERQMKKLSDGHLDGAHFAWAHFAWAGAQDRGKGHYYRVQGPWFVAEYDNTQNDANHIHAVWRDLENDFGEDLLRRHYRTDHPAAGR